MRLCILLLAAIPFFAEAEMYKRTTSEKAGGTYLLDDLDLIPLFLVSTFGRPSEGDGLRVSGEYVFVSEKGEIFTIHDYKSTTVWALDEDLPTPEEFWASESKQEMSLGGKDEFDSDTFINWLLRKQALWNEAKR